MKKCNICGIVKELNKFYKGTTYKDGHKATCKVCCLEWRREYYRTHEEKRNEIKEYRREYYQENRSKGLEQAIKYYIKNRERLREGKRKYDKDYRKEHSEYRNSHERDRRKDDIQYRLSGNIARSIAIALRGNKNGRHWESLVGYTVIDLKKHLEKQFKEEMNWEKFLNGEIHIDHIIPQSLFRYENPDNREFKQCWALANLQPLWAEENIKKSNKIRV